MPDAPHPDDGRRHESLPDPEWPVRESAVEYETDWFTGGYDLVEQPDGSTKRYYWAELATAVVVVARTDDNGNTSEFFGPLAEQLPVELASFEATQSGNRTTTLRWSTASERNNAGFRVQHQGPTAASWSKLGFVEGNGTTTTAQSYRFDAENLSVGTHRFRLQQVDLDGSTTLHDPVTVDLEGRQAPVVTRQCAHPSIEGSVLIPVPLLKMMRIEGHALEPDHALTIAHTCW